MESLTLNDNFEFYLGNQQIVPVKQISRDNKEFQKIIDQVLKLTGTEVTEDYSNSSIEYGQKELEHLNYDEPTYRTVSMGAYNYFHKGGKKEIIWDIISEEDGKTLLISKFGLDTKQFSMQRDKTWADCSLRRWLNDDFFQGAFSDIEKAAIIETQVLPDQNAEFDTNAGEPCKDRLFVLSKSEIGEKMAVACGGLGRLATKATWFLTLTLQEDIQEKAVMHKGRKYVFAPLCGLTCRY